MDWNDLRYLLAVQEGGSLARAAAELGVTKATVSRRIQALEDALGAQLVERRPEGMVVTAAGARAVRAAEVMRGAARDLRASVREDHGAVEGVVRVTAAEWLAERLIIPAVAHLRARHPALELRIHGSHALLDVDAGEADLALRNVRPASGSLVTKRVGELAGCVYGSRLYLERRGVPRGPDDLGAHDLLTYELRGGMPGFEWMSEPRWEPRVVMRAGDPMALMSAARAGLGLAAIPCLIGETEPRLARVEALGVGFSPLYVVYREADRALARLVATVRFVEEVLRENEAVLMGRGARDERDDHAAATRSRK